MSSWREGEKEGDDVLAPLASQAGCSSNQYEILLHSSRLLTQSLHEDGSHERHLTPTDRMGWIEKSSWEL